MNSQEYWKEVNDIADNMIEECMDEARENITEPDTDDEYREYAEELINDSRLHETIDGHQWVIYYSYNLDVIQHSDNAEYMGDNFGGESMTACIDEGGVDSLHAAMAFWALYADVQELISDKLDHMT